MSAEGFYSRMNRYGDMFKLFLLLSGAFSMTLTVGLTVGAILWRAYDGREYLRNLLGITEIATIVSGEDGIINVQQPRSYALSPASKSEGIVWGTYYARRTERGVECKAVEPIFTFVDRRNVRRAGILLSPVIQIGRDWDILEVRVKMPDDLSLGPIVMTVQIEYDCPWGREYDDLPPLQFLLVT